MADSSPIQGSTAFKLPAQVEKWNRKLHIYVGLYLLIFLWLFAVSGLLMNHPRWFEHQPERTRSQQEVRLPDATSALAKARDVKSQLRLTGEIIQRAQKNPGHLVFMVMRPNERHAVDLDLRTRIASVEHIAIQPADTLGDLHTFTGIRGIWNEPDSRRDWLATRLWSFSIDAICVGLMFLVVSSVYMGYRLKKKRQWVLASFALGVLACSFFIWGLARIG